MPQGDNVDYLSSARRPNVARVRTRLLDRPVHDYHMIQDLSPSLLPTAGSGGCGLAREKGRAPTEEPGDVQWKRNLAGAGDLA